MRRAVWCGQLMLVGSVVLAAGCHAKSGAPPPVAPSGGRSNVRQKANSEVDVTTVDSLASLESLLGEAEAELQQAHEGTERPVEIVEAAPMAEGGASRDDDDEALDRCERIVALTDRICVLRDRVCDLAQEHSGQPRYLEVCERAESSCSKATTAAEPCIEGLED